MSFRVKASHGFLKPPQAAPPQKSIDDLLDLNENKDEEDTYDWLRTPLTKTSVPGSSATAAHPNLPVNTSKVNAQKGLVIRPNYRAHEDYM